MNQIKQINSAEEKQRIQTRINALKTEKNNVFVSTRQEVFQSLLFSKFKNTKFVHKNVYKLV